MKFVRHTDATLGIEGGGIGNRTGSVETGKGGKVRLL